MKDKKKGLLLASVITLTAATLTVVLTTNKKTLLKKAFADNDPTYTLTTGNCTEAEVGALEFVRNTSNGNPITFKLTGEHSYDKYSISKINATGSGRPSASIYNETPIRGLTQMTFSAQTSTYYKCFYGSSLENLEYATEVIKDRVGESITIEFQGINIQHFRLVRVNCNGNTSASFLKSISLEYKCENVVNRGVSFANGNGIDLPVAFPSDGTFVFDYKATSGSTLRMCFMQSDWSKYFGYMTLSADGSEIYGSAKREHHFGIRTSPLSDGYVHVTIDFTKFDMTNAAYNRDNVPNQINVIYFSGCDAEGYIDILPSTHALEGMINNYAVSAPGSTQSIDFPFTVDIETNMEVVIDMVYDDPTQNLVIGFGYSGSSGNYYGYNTIAGSTNRIAAGAYIDHISSTHIRVIYDLDDLGLAFEVNALTIIYIRSSSVATGTLNFYINL